MTSNPPIKASNNYPDLGLFIDGKWRTGDNRKVEPVYNPSTGTVLKELTHASKADLDDALKAAEQLKGMGIEASVVNARFVKPLDEKTILRHVKTSGKALTIEENTLIGGFGSAVLELLEEKGLKDIALHRLGAPDAYIGYDDPKNIKAAYGLNVEGIVRNAHELVRAHK